MSVVTYQPTKEEVIESAKYGLIGFWQFCGIWPVVGFIFCSLSVLLFWEAGQKSRTVIIWGIVLFCAQIIGWPLRWTSWRRAVVKFYEKQAGSPNPITFSLEENGVHYSGTGFDVVEAWDKIVRWKENEDFILLYTSRTTYSAIFKKIGKQGFPLDILRQRLLTKVGKPK